MAVLRWDCDIKSCCAQIYSVGALGSNTQRNAVRSRGMLVSNRPHPLRASVLRLRFLARQKRTRRLTPAGLSQLTSLLRLSGEWPPCTEMTRCAVAYVCLLQAVPDSGDSWVSQDRKASRSIKFLDARSRNG